MLFSCAQTTAIAGTPSNTVCTNQKPFRVCVHSDNAEYAFPAADGEGTLANNRGFQLSKFLYCRKYQKMDHFIFQVTSNKLSVSRNHEFSVCNCRNMKTL